MEVENSLCFFITYEKCETVIELYEYDTVELLKIEIHKHFHIPTHKQRITGWRNTPISDDTILKMCADTNGINCLGVTSHSHDRDLEVAATLNFVQTIPGKYDVDGVIEFHTCKLNDAISEACFVPLENRKVLLLYLHKSDDRFSTTFMENLKNPEVVGLLKRNFFVVGWNIEEGEYRSALKKAFKQCNALSIVGDEINCNVATALCIVPIKDSVTVVSCLKGNVSTNDFLLSLENSEKFFIIENQQERDLEELEREAGTANDMNADKYQQLMVDMLGDRDYDGFEYDQHEFLKKKIAFALMGPPKEVSGYDEKSMKQVERLFSTILENSNEIAQYKDKVEISFIYNCTVPLPAEKIKRAKKNQNYNPNTDLMPVPIFVLRRCHGSLNPCRVFVDHTGRTYQTWEGYKNRNKLHECEMVLPLNGRYDVDANGMVLLERHLSPACGIDTKILRGVDYVSIAGGLMSGGIFVAAALPAVAVAPIVLVAGGIAGVGVGIYSIARSAYTLYDRNRHKETMSFTDSEARGAYINILAGALGFVGAGANVAVTQLASRGVNIGVGARTVVDGIAFINIGASGIAVLNSGYDVFDKWLNDNQSPSLLTMVQLASSVLFFGNAVYNFKTCSTIVEETQFRTLENYQDSLRSNRHRKVLNKLVKETVRQNNFNEAQGRAEVISAIRNIQNKDEVFAVLTRSNKEMNKKGIKFSAAGGEIVLNGINVDFNEFSTMNKKQATSFLSKLSKSKPTQGEMASTRFIATDILTGSSALDIETVVNITSKMLYYCSGDIKAKIISAISCLLASLAEPIRAALDELFPNHSKLAYLTKMVVDFFVRFAEELEAQYKKWVQTGDDGFYNPLFRQIDVDQTKRVAKFFEWSVNMYYKGTQLTEQALEELLTYFHGWLTKQIYDNQKEKETTSRRIIHSAQSPSKKVQCPVCGGSYYNRKN